MNKHLLYASAIFLAGIGFKYAFVHTITLQPRLVYVTNTVDHLAEMPTWSKPAEAPRVMLDPFGSTNSPRVEISAGSVETRTAYGRTTIGPDRQLYYNGIPSTVYLLHDVNGYYWQGAHSGGERRATVEGAMNDWVILHESLTRGK